MPDAYVLPTLAALLAAATLLGVLWRAGQGRTVAAAGTERLEVPGLAPGGHCHQ
ncbi:hypothetical protein ACQ3I4_08855 [Zafaria sp. Z1313]|uniref:hypothetical protein n=1 Tax=Zafaria sp. Z1313 TaxID=3423202 RepID=UPI003D301EF3